MSSVFSFHRKKKETARVTENFAIDCFFNASSFLLLLFCLFPPRFILFSFIHLLFCFGTKFYFDFYSLKKISFHSLKFFLLLVGGFFFFIVYFVLCLIFISSFFIYLLISPIISFCTIRLHFHCAHQSPIDLL